MPSQSLTLTFLLLCGNLLGCGGAVFSGSTSKKNPPTSLGKHADGADATPHTDVAETSDDGLKAKQADANAANGLYWGCDAQVGDSREALYKEGQDLQLRLTGELCRSQEEAKPLTLTFIVDTSGSMGTSLLPGMAAGSDPLVNGSCGRHKAVLNTIDYLREQSVLFSEVEIKMVLFSDKAEGLASVMMRRQGDHLLPDAVPSAEVLCRAGGGTEYVDAFAKAEAVMANAVAKAGPKLVYFISDGVPDEVIDEWADVGNFILDLLGLDSATRRAIAAGEKFRKRFPNSSVFALYLTAENNKNAMDLLGKVVGNADKVRRVANPQALVEQVKNLQAGEYTADRIVLKQASGEELKLASLVKQDGRYVWESQLLTIPHSAVPDELVFDMLMKDNAGFEERRKLKVTLRKE